jgi:1-deoxy-D-xylulose-5-phosphate reductoisomerase
MEQSRQKGIAILGSTGSIGTQALSVIEANPEFFAAELLTAYNNHELLIAQAKKFKPNAVVIVDENRYVAVCDALKDEPVKVYAGRQAVSQLMDMDGIDVVLTAMVGFAGLEPTIAAAKKGKRIALANKETLVVAGHVIQKLVLEHHAEIIPVDSEHSAIFQCLAGETGNDIEKIYLTASGGPFRGKDLQYLSGVKKQEALRHPNWEMGAKITIDSASMMNKGLEMIEARWLFDLDPSQIDVIIHPQSIIHSIVQFTDGSMKAQMGLPDMKLPIQYAFTFPARIQSDLQRFDFIKYPQLTFEIPDKKTFRCLMLAEEALKKGGNLPCIMNAANEVAVAAFLKDEISFTDIPAIAEACMEHIGFVADPSLQELQASDTETRSMAHQNAAAKKTVISAG